MKTALIAGSTGLIGNQLLELLLQSTDYSKVVALTRQDLVEHYKLVQIKIDLGTIAERAEALKADDVFCCLGTTIARAGSKEKFHQVDFYYPLLLARIAHAAGAKQYMLISSLGADKKSFIYYAQVKGEIEEAVSSVGFESVHIFRPSLLLGRTEIRSGEVAAKYFYKVFGFLIPKKFKAIASVKVARAMLYFASQNKKGNFIHESLELQNF